MLVPAWIRRARGVLLGASCGVLAASCGERARVPSPGASLHLIGRFDTTDPAGPRFAWSGSAIEAHFRGAGLAVRLRAATLPHTAADEHATSYAVRVDGRDAPPLAVHEGEDRYVVAAGLDPAAIHDVVLVREAEASAGVHQLLGVDVAGGELVPVPPRRTVEVIGDSISCGYGVLGADATCPFTFATERATAAYPWLAARALGADAIDVCFSGRGVVRNYEGDAIGTMPELYERTFPGGASFDFAKGPEPAAVVVALGTNDFLGGKEALDVDAFERAYVTLLARVRLLRPHAFVVVLESPMLPPERAGSFPSDTRAAARESLSRVVAAREAAGDRRVALLPSAWQGARRGCDHHPNAEVQREVAAQLAALLGEKLGAR